ncbi:hypothetical protein [Sinanaerobacter chloroacetimidivorans]|jgi:hypothetical protein|uniref:Uncharacterized protein n=1 Tax=Sinanaerobacter chloroacetimidivorans TaxID=2818044 RepID=A0A8J7W321_9FIRM|nr:hypothetical protein [Sinanaerobacter chloroacetimidivorans]MBR0599569.1 hypothetical protein [Sinanaerobacter chloroacetimidivorans]
MFQTKRKITCLILAMAVILSMSGSVFAEAPDGSVAQSIIEPQNIGTASVNFYRTGTNTSQSIVSADTYTIAEYIQTTITLQSYNYSTQTWSSVGASRVETVYNDNGIYVTDNWSTSSSTTYRLKVVVKDKVGSVTSTVTLYSSSI